MTQSPRRNPEGTIEVLSHGYGIGVRNTFVNGHKSGAIAEFSKFHLQHAVHIWHPTSRSPTSTRKENSITAQGSQIRHLLDVRWQKLRPLSMAQSLVALISRALDGCYAGAPKGL
jgi:hypothetical protein